MDNHAIQQALEKRLGSVHARQRLGIEQDKEPRVFGGGLNYFHPENWISGRTIIRLILQGTGFYWRGRQNTLKHQLINNDIRIADLPTSFEGFTLLHLSDLHADMYPPALEALIAKVKSLDYDICVMTGDYRARTFGSIDAAVDSMKHLLEHLKSPVYSVLGNHDSVRMIPPLEQLGCQFLLNETVQIERKGEIICLAGIDDAHYYRVDNIEKVAEQIDPAHTSILLSHTPEIYRQAAHADFNLMFSGHTHGGQICLPGGIPLTLDATLPRFMGAGPWQYGKLQGYTSRGAGTSIVPVRINCPPEITLHRLRCA